LDSVAMPIAMYFGLSRGTNLSPNALFSIVTAALGGVSIVEYVYRFWQLWKVNSSCRPEGAGRKEVSYASSSKRFRLIVSLTGSTGLSRSCGSS
jgi:hypothetical protein